MPGLSDEPSSDLSAILTALNHCANVATTDMRGVITYANDRLCEVSGYSRDELVGSSHEILSSGFHDAAFFDDMLRTIHSGAVWRAEICNRAKSGADFWVDCSISPKFGPDGLIKGFVSIGYDITKAKHSEAILSEAIDSIPDGFVVYDRDDRLLICNNAYREIYAAQAGNLVVGASFHEILLAALANGSLPAAGVTEESRSAWLESRMMQYRNPGPDTVQQLSDGRWLQVRERRAASGHLVGFRTDVTGIMRQRAMLQTIVDTYTGGITIFDADLQLVLCNENYKRLLEFPDSLFASGMPSMECLLRFDAKRGEFGAVDVETEVAARMERARRPSTQTYEIERKNGKTIEIVSSPIPGGGLVSFHFDVTGRKRTQAALEERENFLLSITNNIPGMIAYWNRDLRCEFANSKYFIWFGRTEEEMRSIHLKDLLGDAVFQQGERYTQAALRGETQQFERTITKPDGEIAIMWVQYLPHWVDGEVRGFLVLASDVTPLKRIEQKLHVSDAALKSVSQGVVITRTDGTIESANTAFEDITGYTSEELQGRDLGVLQGVDGAAGALDEALKSIREQTEFSGEFLARRRNGESFWNEMTISPVHDEAGRVSHFIAVCRDVTERINTRERLLKSEAIAQQKSSELEMTLQHMNQGISAYDRSGRMTVWNRQYAEMFGMDPDAIGSGMTLIELLELQKAHGDFVGEPQHLQDAIFARVADGEKFVAETQLGSGRLIRTVHSPSPDGGWIATHEDITEWRLAHDRLKESQERLSTALEASNTGLWDTYPQIDREYWSDTWYKMLGYAPGAMPSGRDSFLSLVHPDDLGVLEASSAQLVNNGDSAIDVEFRLRRADGAWCWIKSVGKVVERSPDGRPLRIIGVHTDMTAEMQRRHELAAAREAALAASRAKSDFLARMSHEIRTPMNAIIGLTHLLNATEMTSRQRDYTSKIQTASKSLLALLNDILDFSKIEAGKLGIEAIEFDIEDLVSGAEAMTAQKMQEKGLEFVVNWSADLPHRLVGDPLRLSQVLINLLSNAAKFTAQGKVTLRVGGERRADNEFMLHISVDDTGIGMTADQTAALFKPFMQADDSTTRRFGGTGLGLAISRELATLMHGQVEIVSAPGVGTTCDFRVPLRISESLSRKTISGARNTDVVRREPRAAAPIPSGASILVVEDNAINQQVIVELLGHIGLAASVVGSGEAALKTLAARSFDLVFMDVQMPGMDGFETTRRIRSDLGMTSIIIIAQTANAMPEDRRRCLAAGMNDYIAKPIDPVVLGRKVSQWLGVLTSSKPIETSAPVSVTQPPTEPAAAAAIDIEVGLRNLGGNRDLLMSLLKELADEYPKQASAVRAAARESDWFRLNRNVHSLKGTSSALGAITVARIASDLEGLTVAGATIDPQQLAPLLESLLSAMDRTTREITTTPVTDSPALARF